MISSLDPFALSFDSIKVEPKASNFGAPASAAASPFALTGDELSDPGFYLLDDAGGRFTIDRDTGIVTLTHDHVLELESGAIHPVKIKVVEQSGVSYELNFRLRVTGRVPQVAGSHENEALLALTAAPLLDLMTPREITAPSKSVAPRAAPAVTLIQPWIAFSATVQTHGALRRLGSEHARFGTLLEPPAASEAETGAAQLSLNTPLPAPAPASAHWLI